MTFNATAIILRRWDHGEWDRWYTVYTRERGKLTLIAKGTRRPRAKLAAHLEPCTEVDLVVARGRTMDRVTFACAIAHGHRFAASWEDAAAAAYGVECIDGLTRDAHPDPAVFDLLREYLASIANTTCSPSHGEEERERGGTTEAAALRTGFALRLLVLLGYAPALDRCLDCREPFAPVAAFGSPERGGLSCIRCRSSGRTGTVLDVRDREQLRSGSARFRSDSWGPAATVFVDALLDQHLVAPLRTSSVGGSLTRTASTGTVAMS